VLYMVELEASGSRRNADTIRADLGAIGIDVEVRAFPSAVFEERSSTRGEPFDMAFDRLVVPWVDPYQYVNRLLDGRMLQAKGNTNRSFFNSARYNRLMDKAAQMRGNARCSAYGRLARDIARDAAPMAAAFVRNTRFFLSSRVGCVRTSAHGLDLAGLCVN
jgi:ABC-type transport system substrate-binding protein